MPENREMLRQSLLADLTVLHGNLEKTWTIALSLPVGKTRTELELIHQSCGQLGLNMRRTLMEMI